MMSSLGHTVYHYGAEKSVVDATEHVTIITEEQRQKWWGTNDFKKDFYAVDWKPELSYWRETNENAIKEIAKRISQKDFICLIGGSCQRPIADAFPTHMSVEYGIGYEGTFSKYRVFESYAWMHYIYGREGTLNGIHYDAVVPNYFDPVDFPFSADKDNYFLFIGRLIHRKGLHVAAEICNTIGARLVVAGQGMVSYEAGKLVTNEVTVTGNIDYVGTLDVEARGKLMSRARAVMVPTQYIGPFEGVSIEAMICGTPVITTDWGCFSETVLDGITGYRTRTLGEGVWAAQNVDKLCPKTISDYALRKWAIDVVKYRYEEYFKELLNLWNKGWYTLSYDPIKRRHGAFI